jgi:hypothetical protein
MSGEPWALNAHCRCYPICQYTSDTKGHKVPVSEEQKKARKKRDSTYNGAEFRLHPQMFFPQCRRCGSSQSDTLYCRIHGIYCGPTQDELQNDEYIRTNFERYQREQSALITPPFMIVK